MKKGFKIVTLFLLVVTLTGCRIVLGSSSSSVNPSISIVMPPFPNDAFEKISGNKLVLIENQTNKTFSRENNFEFEGEVLNAINFRETEEVWLPYDLDATQSTSNRPFNEVSAYWQTIPNLLPSALYEGQQALDLLYSWLEFDTFFNVVHRNRQLRDLSFDVIDSPYFWFNNYVDQQSWTYKRFNNQFIYGGGVTHRLFQTGNMIDIIEVYQLNVVDDHLITIVDQTFPTGWTGARDIKVTLPTDQFDLATAMTIGPVQNILNEVAFWKFIGGVESENDITLTIQSSNQDSFVFTASLIITSEDDDDILELFLAAEVENLAWISWHSHYTLYREFNA